MEVTHDTIVILKNNASMMKPVEAYLSNRGLYVHSTHRLQEALALIIKNKPNFVILSADHPHKKLKILPKLLGQAFKIPIIAFVDNTSSAALASLHEMSLEYKLFPPVSGPAIERILHKIKKDLEAKPPGEDPNKISNSTADNTSDNSGHTVIQGSDQHGDSQTAQSALQALMSEMASEEDSTSSGNTGPIIQKGTAGEKINYNPQSQGSESQSQTQKGNAGNYVSSWKPEEEKKKTEGSSITQEGISKGKKMDVIFGKEDSIIVKGTQSALDESVILRSPEEENKSEMVSTASHVACLRIESSQFSGYLVAALGKDKKLDVSFMNLVKERLFAFLRDHGEVIHDEDASMDLTLEKVEFQDWAKQHAEFLQRSLHNDDEIAVAFFPSDQKKMQVESSAREDMVKLKLEDIHDDMSVDFDVFVHLPENNKFILYTPEGNSLMTGQKQRLKTKGVTHLHLRKNDASEVRRYQARIFLNEKISAFKKSLISRS